MRLGLIGAQENVAAILLESERLDALASSTSICKILDRGGDFVRRLQRRAMARAFDSTYFAFKLVPSCARAPQE